MNNFKALTAIAIVILTSGCVSVTVEQEFHPDGTSDIAFDVTSDSEFALDLVEPELEDAFATENAVLDDRDNGFTYTFENVAPHEEELPDFDVQEIDEEADDDLMDLQRDDGILYTTFRIEMDAPELEDEDEDIEEESIWGEEVEEMFEPDINYDIKHFGELVKTNGQELEDGGVRFDLTRDKDYYLEFEAFRPSMLVYNLLSEGACTPEWDCGEWSSCEGFEQERSCEVVNDCTNYMFEPQEVRSCQNPSIEDVDIVEGEFGDTQVEVEFDNPGFGNLQLIKGEEIIGSTYLAQEETDEDTFNIPLTEALEEGEYEVVLEESGMAQTQETISLDGPEIEINDVDAEMSWDSFMERYSIDSVSAEIENTGDVPIEVQGSYTIAGQESGFGIGTTIGADETEVMEDVTFLHSSDGVEQISVEIESGEEVLAEHSETLGQTDQETNEQNGDESVSDADFETSLDTPSDVEYTLGERFFFYYRAKGIAEENDWADVEIEYTMESHTGEEVYTDSFQSTDTYTQTGNIGGNDNLIINDDWQEGEYVFEVEITDLETDTVDRDEINFEVKEEETSPKIVIHAADTYGTNVDIDIPVVIYGMVEDGYYDFDGTSTIYYADTGEVRSESSTNHHDQTQFNVVGTHVDYVTQEAAGFELEFEAEDNIGDTEISETATYTVE